MKLLYLIFVIFCMTQFTTSWRCGHGHGHRHGFGGFGGFNLNSVTNTNAAIGHFNNSQVNMSNGGCGNVQANSKKTAYFRHRR